LWLSINLNLVTLVRVLLPLSCPRPVGTAL